MNRELFALKVNVLRENKTTKGLKFNLIAQSPNNSYDLEHREIVEANVYFDDTCQDVMSALGAPSDVFFKSEDLSKLNQNDVSLLQNHVHSTNTNPYDYFYNYFTLGIVSY